MPCSFRSSIETGTTAWTAARQPNIAVELALLLALATLWGGSYTFIKLGVATIPPITLIAARTRSPACCC